MAKISENIVDLTAFPIRHVGNAASPFRYPGGKGFLTSYLDDQIRQRFGHKKPSYAEPFCGGAGSALNLLVDGSVSHLHLNDADYRIFSAWKAMLDETDRFLENLRVVKPDLTTWEESLQKLHEKPTSQYSFDVGFATFFINRTSRSGVVLGSGPIGGYNQEGNWKIDARFNKAGLSERIRRIGNLSDSISLSCLDGLEFCRQLEKEKCLDTTFLFVDPPYVHAGGRLYHDGMNLAKHDALAEWLLSGIAPHCLLTYDDHRVVRENFTTMQEHRIQVRYSLGKRRLEKELMYMTPIAN